MNKLLRSVQVKKVTVVFTLLLSLCFSYGFAKKLAALPQLINPVSIEIDEDELYVLDEVVVYVYSLKDYRLLRKFGKKGEGQGQLMPNTEVPPAMNIANGNVFLNSQIKMIQLSKKGEIIKEERIPFSFQTIPFGENYISIKIGTNSAMNTFNVILYDPDFKQLKVLYSRERIPLSRRGKLSLPPELIIVRSSEDKLFVFDQKKGFDIDTFDLQGKRINHIKMDYQRIKMTESFKKAAEAWFRSQPSFHMATEELREMIYFPDYLPMMRNFIIKNQKLYIRTYNTRGNSSEFVILDFHGKLIKQTFLPDYEISLVQLNSSNIFTFFNEKYYYLAKMESGWEIHVEEIK
jgi:hypothetical protein